MMVNCTILCLKNKTTASSSHSILPYIYLLVLILVLISGCAGKKEPGMEIKPEKIPEELTEGQKRIAAWHRMLRKMSNAPEMEQLITVNSFFNRLEFVDDRILWGKKDYWSTPREMLLKNGGDCEDFATAKYFSLRRLKIPANRMRLTYVKVLRLKQPHMVLSYYAEPTADPLILDSLVKTILPASKRNDIIPIYSFNSEGLWLTMKEKSIPLDRPEILTLWRDLQFRFTREAIADPLFSDE